MKKLIALITVLTCISTSSIAGSFKNHFSFQPLKKPVVTSSGHANPVDNFVSEKMNGRGIVFNVPADKRTLVYRLYIDLTGLPPTFEEVEKFANSQDPQAYEKLVEQVLSSERYGEKQARNWMDVVRYSDTRGANNRNQEGEYVYAWTYRDYLIKSFNKDKPYDQFLKEQLAADLMLEKGETDIEALAALGFLSVGKYNRNANDRIDERIDATSKAMLGLTVACARCHDHKFDPVDTEDYYAWHSIFASLRDKKVEELPIIEDTTGHRLYKEYIKRRAVTTNAVFNYKLVQFSKWTQHSRTNAGRYMGIAFTTQRLMDPATARDYQRTNKIDKVDIMTGVVRNWQREMNGNKPFWQAYKSYSAKDKITPADLDKLKDKELAAYFKKEKVNSNKTLVLAYNKLLGQAYNFGTRRIKIKKKVPTPDEIINKLLVEPVNILFGGKAPVALGNIDTFHNAIPNGLRNRYTREIGNRQKVVIQLEQTHPAAPRRAQMLADARPVTSPVFIKGNAGKRGKPALKGYIAFFEEKRYSEGTGRYELANSIASPNNPLTSRVIVNRTWQWLFEEGITPDPNNLGILAEKPQQVRLMDFLAVYLIQNNWSLKELNRLIVKSKTYKQSSTPNPRNLSKDPANTFLHYNPIHRLTFEEMRDAVLMSSGELQLAHDGRPIGMYIHPKRSVYARIDRANVPSSFSAFDFANPSLSTGKRDKTIVPQQALFLMNGSYIEARVQAFVKSSKFRNEDDQIKSIYQRVFSRNPSQIEIRLGRAFIKKQGADDYIHALFMSNEFAYVR